MLGRKVLLSGFFILICALQSIAEEKKIVLVSTEHLPFSGDEIEHQGVASVLVRTAFERSGYTAVIEFYPWNRCLALAKSGQKDGITPIWYTPERDAWLVFSENLDLPNTIGFYKNKDRDISFTTYEDLTPYVIGYVMGYAYQPEFMKTTEGFRRQRAYNNIELLDRLVQGRIDLAVIGKRQGMYLLQTKFSEYQDQYEFLEPPIEIRKQYIAISRKTENCQAKLDAFNRGLKEIHEDGTADWIRSQHGMK